MNVHTFIHTYYNIHSYIHTYYNMYMYVCMYVQVCMSTMIHDVCMYASTNTSITIDTLLRAFYSIDIS